MGAKLNYKTANTSITDMYDHKYSIKKINGKLFLTVIFHAKMPAYQKWMIIIIMLRFELLK